MILVIVRRTFMAFRAVSLPPCQVPSWSIQRFQPFRHSS